MLVVVVTYIWLDLLILIADQKCKTKLLPEVRMMVVMYLIVLDLTIIRNVPDQVIV